MPGHIHGLILINFGWNFIGLTEMAGFTNHEYLVNYTFNTGQKTMIKRIAFVLVMLLIMLPELPFAQETIQDDSIKQIIQQQAEIRKIPSIVVGIIDTNGKRVISYGKQNKVEGDLANGNTLYEIGSITKVFTSLALQIMADHGELNVSDQISKFLPNSVTTPTRDGKEITLLDLSSQISGLPRMPSNFSPADFSNPFADYTPEKLYAYISSYKLTRGIGEKYEYSNLGTGLLGHILTLKANSDYETLIQKLICVPLNMKNTLVTITPELRQRLALGYDSKGNQVKNWDFSALAGAGVLKSSVNDLLIFLEANLGLTKTTLQTAMEKIHKPRNSTTTDYLDIAMGWHVWKKYDKEIIWHNGGTAGYRAFIGFDKENKKGIVLLTNSSAGADDIGLHLLESKYEINQK